MNNIDRMVHDKRPKQGHPFTMQAKQSRNKCWYIHGIHNLYQIGLLDYVYLTPVCSVMYFSLTLSGLFLGTRFQGRKWNRLSHSASEQKKIIIMALFNILIFHFVRKIQIVQEIPLKGITDIMIRKFVSQKGCNEKNCIAWNCAILFIFN